MKRSGRTMLKDGISADCTLNKQVLAAMLLGIVDEYPCDRCNANRAECHGYPRADEPEQPS